MSTVIVSQDELSRYNSLIPMLKKHVSEAGIDRGRPLTYLVKTYGCQLNESDSEKIEGIFRKIGLVEAKEDETPDYLIFNTCTIRENADIRLFGNLGAYKSRKKENRDMFIAVCGCMMKQQENIDRIKKSFPYVDACFGPSDIHMLPKILANKMNQRKRIFSVSEEDYLVDDNDIPVLHKRKFRALVPIMYGCNNFCTYCIVPFVRGRERSRSPKDVLAEVRSLIAQGYPEITLLGQNVDSYRYENYDFSALLQEIAQIDGKFRLRFMTSHPKDFDSKVIDVIASCPNICNNIHLPVQSGSNRVLKLMNRRYTRERYLEIIDEIRGKLPGVGITSDIMTGFPTETDEDFADTVSLMERVRFSNAFTFVYSPRKGTVAAEMEQLPAKVKQDRITELVRIQNRISSALSNDYLGKTEEILTEDVSPKHEGCVCGRTESGRLVTYPGQADLVGKFVNVKIESARSSALFGRIR